MERAGTFAELYANHARDVYRFALYLSGNRALADDILSETFLRAWDSTAEIRTETVRGYLFTIARNVFLHEVRRGKREGPLEDHHAVESFSAEIDRKEELRAAFEALQTLAEVDRTAVLLRAEEGMSYEEIARVLGISLASVKVKIHRARLRLAEHRKGALPWK